MKNRIFKKREYFRIIDSLLMDETVGCWCFCKYCQLNDIDYNKYSAYEKKFIKNIKFFSKVKVWGNRKKKWSFERLCDTAEFNDVSTVYMCCTFLFDDNRIKATKKEQEKVCNLFIQNLPAFIGCISNEITVDEYLKKVKFV